MILLNTLLFSTVSIPLGRSYQTTSTTMQDGEPGTSRGDEVQYVRRLINQWRGDNKTSVRNQDDSHNNLW